MVAKCLFNCFQFAIVKSKSVINNTKKLRSPRISPRVPYRKINETVPAAQKTSRKSTQFQMPAHRTDKSAHLNEMGNHYNPTTLCETSFPSYTRQDIPMHSTKERTEQTPLLDFPRNTTQNNSKVLPHHKSGTMVLIKIPG